MAGLGPGGRLILTAPTGSGKSTRLPLWCLACQGEKVLVIEPRRVAARALAEWVAGELAEAVGQKVGYAVRFESCQSAETRALFVTPGVARRLLTDTGLADYGVVIFDEFHERSWETDALLALLAAIPQGPRLLIMSATLTAGELTARYRAQLMEVQDRGFPVTISYLEEGEELTVPSARGLAERAARAVRQAWHEETDGTILVFLPGLASMHDVASRLGGLPTVLLHGSFTQKEQSRAFQQGLRQVILATNVAESSLTLPSVTTVIDGGLERRQIHQSGYVALATVPIAQSSADQRAGRAGRVRAGRCIRLWSERARLEAVRPPEICRMELDDLVLFLASLSGGVESPAQWLDAPPQFAWLRAVERARKAVLLGSDGRLTPLGQQAQRLPLEPDWARLLVSAPVELRGDLCDLAALAVARRSPLRSTRCEETLAARKKDFGEEPWTQALNLISLGDASRHALEQEGLSHTRQVAEELRALSGAAPLSRAARRAPLELPLFLARHWSERFFLRRPGRLAWGNGEVECRLARGEELPEDCQACFMLQVEPILSRGLKVELQGRWGLPVPLSHLRQAGLGEPELTKIRWVDGRLSARVSVRHAGREIGCDEELLVGNALRLGLAQLARAGTWRPEVMEMVQEEHFYLALAAALRGELMESIEPEIYMAQRLELLGVETTEDLELLEATDFLPSGLEVEEKEALARSYPRLYRFGGLSFSMEYLPMQRLVVMHSLGQTKGVKLNSQHLPRWNGWRVELDERGRRTVLRT